MILTLYILDECLLCVPNSDGSLGHTKGLLRLDSFSPHCLIQRVGRERNCPVQARGLTLRCGVQWSHN